MKNKIKKFVREHKTTIIAVTATAVPLIVLNIKFFQANRAWASRRGCHDNTNHLHFNDEAFKRVVNGGRWGFDFDDKKVASKGVVIMTHETYDGEWKVVKDFLAKHGLLDAFYESNEKTSK